MWELIDNIRNLLSSDDENIIELEHIDNIDEKEKIKISVHELAEPKDSFNILREYRDNKIVFVKIMPSMQANAYDMSQILSAFKKTCNSRNGKIIGLDSRWIVLLPEDIDIVSATEDSDAA